MKSNLIQSINNSTSTESEALENTVKDLNYRNEILSSQNQLLEFNLNMVMDMLALAKLDLVQAQIGGGK